MSIEVLLQACALQVEERQLLELALRLSRRRALATAKDYRYLKNKINNIRH